MSVAAQNNWSEANQRYLAAEFARLKLRLGAEGDAEAMAASVHAARAALPGPAAIDTLAELFGLSAFERDLLLLVAGVEMDAEWRDYAVRLKVNHNGRTQPSAGAGGVGKFPLERVGGHGAAAPLAFAGSRRQRRSGGRQAAH